MTLPDLRDELVLLAGPAAPDGSPTWTLHDPLGNRFFRLSWPAFEVLSRWHLGNPQGVADSVSRETVLTIGPEDVAEMIGFLSRGQLLKPVGPKDVDRLLAIHETSRTSWAAWLLHHYLFFRVPLVRPDALLAKAFPYLAWIGTRTFRLATLAALLSGLFLVGRQWEVFGATLVDHFSLGGLAAFGLALCGAKVVHELAHAFTAKAFGCRVPTMGVAFLVLWPMLYTDVNDAWKLTDRRQRLLVGGAGILAELTLAAWATLAWGLLPDGIARTMAFTLAATTWISSLAINLAPFMRFDGYFLAMDALNQPNLHPRSFALARWHLREALFGLGEPAPEDLPPGTRRGMVAFAWAVWLYRLVLFLGIAALVYHFFIKVVGVLLFAVEIGWFVIKPIAAEMIAWKQRAGAIRTTRRSRSTLILLGTGLLLLLAPWNGRIAAPALLKARDHAVVYAPSAAILSAIDVAEGESVRPGTVLVRLENPDILHRLDQVEGRIAVLKYELSSIGFDDGFRARSQAITEELGAAIAEKASLVNEFHRLTLTAAIPGVVTDVSPALQPGQWVNPREPILGIRSGGAVEAYVAETDLPRIEAGAAAIFIPEGSGARLATTVAAIDKVAVKALTEPSLAGPFGGDIPARFDSKALVPDKAVYRVRLTMAEPGPDPTVPLRGQVHIEGRRQSLLGHALRFTAAVLIREWGM